MGNVYQPFVSFATYRAQHGALTIYSVWRLDGATHALAQGLVGKAISTKTNGLTGQVCSDRNEGYIAYVLDSDYGEGDGHRHRHLVGRNRAILHYVGTCTYVDSRKSVFCSRWRKCSAYHLSGRQRSRRWLAGEFFQQQPSSGFGTSQRDRASGYEILRGSSHDKTAMQQYSGDSHRVIRGRHFAHRANRHTASRQ